jgi:hypothetical protein
VDDALDDKVSRVLVVSTSGSMVGTPPSDDDESRSKSTLLSVDTGGGKLNRIPLFNLRIDIISG